MAAVERKKAGRVAFGGRPGTHNAAPNVGIVEMVQFDTSADGVSSDYPAVVVGVVRHHVRAVGSNGDKLAKLPTLWTNSYFVATVGGATLEVVKQYVENQRNA